MSISDKKTQRAVINVCYNLKKSPLETEKTINVTFGENRLNGRGNGCDNNFWSGVKNGGVGVHLFSESLSLTRPGYASIRSSICRP